VTRPAPQPSSRMDEPGGIAPCTDRGKTPHVFNRHEWECFLIGAKNGEFDLPVS